MPRAQVREGIELEYDTFGSSADAPLLLVMGLGAQMIAWNEELCERLAGEGFFVIRFDNRDVGLSTRVEAEGFDLGETLAAVFTGQPFEPPYRLADMADDTIGLLDHLGIDAAHVVGASMGGMIAQVIAIGHPDRVRSLTSIMSTTGDPAVGGQSPEAAALLGRPSATTVEEYVAMVTESDRLLGSEFPADEARSDAFARRMWERGYDPAGFGRQLVAVIASGDRTEALADVRVPTLVIHGAADPLISSTGGEATAKAVPGAELVVIDGMGHSLPVELWDRLVELIATHARKAA